MTRAIRRHHTARLKQRRRYHWGRDLSDDSRRLGIAVRTPKPCSCFMCGNARRYAGDTCQEMRAALDEADIARYTDFLTGEYYVREELGGSPSGNSGSGQDG